MKTIKDNKPRPSPVGAGPPHFPMDDDRRSRTVKFCLHQEDDEGKITEVKGYFTVGLYADGMPGEVFIDSSKQGDDIYGLTRCWAIAISMLLQHGVPPQKIYDKFRLRVFQPNGISGVDGVPMAKSIVDLVVRWMEKKLLPTAQDAVDGGQDQDWLEMVEEVSEQNEAEGAE